MSAPMSRPITTATSGGRGDLALTNAPGPNRAVPFLPGMSYGLPGKKRFPKSHIFEFKVGVGRSLGVMGTEVVSLCVECGCTCTHTHPICRAM